MALGCFGVDLVVLEGWKARAMKIVRNSKHPERSMQLLRDKAASIFELGELRPVSKVKSMEEGHCSSWQLIKGNSPGAGLVERFQPVVSIQRQQGTLVPDPPTPVVPDASVVGPDEWIDVVRMGCLGLTVFKVGDVVAGQVNHPDAQGVQVQLPGCLRHEPCVDEGAKLNSIQRIRMKKCIKNRAKLKRTDEGTHAVDGVRILSFDEPLLQVDDEPPDPGISLLQAQSYDKSAQACPTAVGCGGPYQQMKNEVGFHRLCPSGQRKHFVHDIFFGGKRQKTALVFVRISEKNEKAADPVDVQGRRDQ